MCMYSDKYQVSTCLNTQSWMIGMAKSSLNVFPAGSSPAIDYCFDVLLIDVDL